MPEPAEQHHAPHAFYRFLILAAFFLPAPQAIPADSPLKDPNYQALRGDTVAGSWRVNNLMLSRDTGTFTFRSGSFSFGHPVLGKRVFAVFIGNGSFHLTASASPHEPSHLKLITGAEEVDEVFHTAVFCFTDGTAEEIMAKAEATDESPANAAAAFREFRSLVRDYPDPPLGRVRGSILGGEHAANIDAQLLRELYTPGHESFSAYIHGQKHSDLRFIIDPAGAIPQLPSSEEVALIDADPSSDQESILFLSHLKTEWTAHTASSHENHRWVQAESYRIDTTIGSNERLTASAAVRMKIATGGTRIVSFGLLPALRVTAVKLGQESIPFIQEPRKQDASFHAILPQPMKTGEEVELTIDYSGDKVVHNAGGGSFAVGARESWYPSLNVFSDRATYDLTFRVPKQYTLVSIGKLDKSSIEKDTAVTHWLADIPVPVAGFNYGDFKKLSKTDDATGDLIEVYSTSGVPEYLNNSRVSLDPAGMAKSMLADTTNSIRLFEAWFGKLPYSRIAITQQPQFSFGQSWPTLVYLPVSAFLDSTQRYMLMGASEFKFSDFVDEVIPHEVSHQWWGHQVGWASYHDQWLSEGFADFSASLFLEAAGQHDEADKYWERQRHRILDRNQWGASPNDAGPLWLGSRLVWKKNLGAYTGLTYAKGGYILQMLKTLMWNGQTKDQAFMDLMHELTQTGGNASTESFRAQTTKHMTPGMNLGGDNTMNWFFKEWVYGTDIPRYTFDYTIAPDAGNKAADNKFVASCRLTQSGVSDDFRMTVPIYMENAGKQMVRVGAVPILGNTTKTIVIHLPVKPARLAANFFHDVLAAETVNR